MAKLPEQTTVTINSLKQQLLDIVDDATAVEFVLFERFGETSRTISVLEQLKSVAEETASWFSQLSTLQLRIAQAQPIASADMLELLAQVIERTQLRLPAWKRSIQEVEIDWNIP